MPNSSKNDGFAHLLTLLLVAVLIGAAGSSIIPVKRAHLDGKSNVAGVSLAENGDNPTDGEKRLTSLPPIGKPGSNLNENQGRPPMPPPKPLNQEQLSKLTPEQQQKYKEMLKNRPMPGAESSRSAKPSMPPIDDSERLLDNFEGYIKGLERDAQFDFQGGDLTLKDGTGSAQEKKNLAKRINKELEKRQVKIASESGNLALIEKRTAAISKYPLKINFENNTLVVSTPNGDKVLAVLPDQAISNMLTSKVMDDVISDPSTGDAASVPQKVSLEENKGILGYRVKGQKNRKFLGLIPFKTNVDAFVSAENGQVTETTESLFAKLLSRLSQ